MRAARAPTAPRPPRRARCAAPTTRMRACVRARAQIVWDMIIGLFILYSVRPPALAVYVLYLAHLAGDMSFKKLVKATVPEDGNPPGALVLTKLVE